MVAPFAMVAGGTISATQIYKPQNIIAWGKFGAFRTRSPTYSNRVFYSSLDRWTWHPITRP